MPYTKGHPKPEKSGRGPGTVNKKTEAWKQLGDYLINEGADRYMALLQDLSDDKFLDRYENLLEYFKPKLSRSEVKADINPLREKIQSVYEAVQSESDLSNEVPE